VSGSSRSSTGSVAVDSWRDSYNYRAEYFKRNPGLMGCVYFCAYCFKPLFSRKEVQIDHIYPPSRHVKDRDRIYDRKGNLISNTSFLARTLNCSFNTVASCADCNKRKSDSVGLITVRGYVSKFFGSVVFRGVGKILYFIIGGLFKLIFSHNKNKNNTGVLSKLYVVCVYIIIAFIVLKIMGVF
jgi:hypothetical protein